MKKQLQRYVPKNRLACWMDYKNMVYYERDLRNGRIMYIRKFPKENNEVK
jgi:hypothetical protein